MSQKTSAMIYAARPPPLGGVASIVAILHQGLSHRNDVDFVSPIVKRQDGFFPSLVRSLRNTLRLLLAIGDVKRGGKILIFASDNYSFFEKIIWARLVIMRRRIPIVVMVAGPFPIFWNNCSPLLRRVFSSIICHPKFELAAQSEAWRDYYRKTFPSASIGVVGATVAAEFFSHVRGDDLASRNTNNLLLYVGWIIADKGIVDLLDAMAILIKTNPEARLRLVGPLFGKDDYWNNALLERGVSAHVKFTGAISDRLSLIREFDSASVFVFPSHFEGFPVALLEAITLGVACVGTTVGGIPDILDHGQAGILVEPKAPQELAKAMGALLDNPERIETLSRQASNRARKVYSHLACMESYERILGLKES